jgi:RimJ/RimL family protein N-acetyltransferase
VDTGLQTPRLSLRRPGVADLDVVLRLHQNPLTVAHNPSDALADRPAAQRLLQRRIDHWVRHGAGYWAVSWRDDPEVPGFCGVKVMTLRGRPVSNLFYRLDPCAWGQGVGSEAAAAVVEWCRQVHPGAPVIARVRPANHTSARVALKAGLARAAEFDSIGEDGPDWIFASPGWTPA